MGYETVIYEKSENIAFITMNRPEALNAFTPQMLKEIKTAADVAAEDQSVGVLVLTGAGRAFSAGVDLKAMSEVEISSSGVGTNLDEAAKELQKTFEETPKPVIAMVNGFCITGGLEIALACDLIIASVSAKFADTHVKWGLRPSWGMSQRLPNRIGLLKAKELSYTARMINAEQAEKIGLINQAVPADELRDRVIALAQEIMANSMDAVGNYKMLLNQGMLSIISEGLAIEASSELSAGDAADRVRGFK